MTYIKLNILLLLNAVSTVIHTDTHFGATKSVAESSNISPGWVRYEKMGQATKVEALKIA